MSSPTLAAAALSLNCLHRHGALSETQRDHQVTNPYVIPTVCWMHTPHTVEEAFHSDSRCLQPALHIENRASDSRILQPMVLVW